MGINFGTMNNSANSTGAIALDLNKGSLLDLTKREPGLKHIIAGVGWDANNTVPAFDLDISAFFLYSNRKPT